MDTTIRERKRVEEQIRKLNVTLRALRERKKQLNSHIYEFMVRSNIQSYGTIKIASVRPRLKKH